MGQCEKKGPFAVERVGDQFAVTVGDRVSPVKFDHMLTAKRLADWLNEQWRAECERECCDDRNAGGV